MQARRRDLVDGHSSSEQSQHPVPKMRPKVNESDSDLLVWVNPRMTNLHPELCIDEYMCRSDFKCLENSRNVSGPKTGI